MAWADIDGDGQPELITGKRVRAHGLDGDPGSKEPECLYYYKWDKAARKFTRHTISGPGEGVGIGMSDLRGRSERRRPAGHRRGRQDRHVDSAERRTGKGAPITFRFAVVS